MTSISDVKKIKKIFKFQPHFIHIQANSFYRIVEINFSKITEQLINWQCIVETELIPKKSTQSNSSPISLNFSLWLRLR